MTVAVSSIAELPTGGTCMDNRIILFAHMGIERGSETVRWRSIGVLHTYVPGFPCRSPSNPPVIAGSNWKAE